MGESYMLYESITKTEIQYTTLLFAVNLISIVPCFRVEKHKPYSVWKLVCTKMYFHVT